jgi:hypothetical protein
MMIVIHMVKGWFVEVHPKSAIRDVTRIGLMNAQQEFHFLMHDLLRIQEQADLQDFSELTPGLTGAIIEGISGFAAAVLEPVGAAEAYGETDMPEVLSLAATEVVNAASPSFALYPGLTPPLEHRGGLITSSSIPTCAACC